MDKVEQYREYVKQVIKEYAQYKPRHGDIEVQTIFDAERDHYQKYLVGWKQGRRIHGCVIHIDIKDGKIWIQHDGTEYGVAHNLVELGVPAEDIVPAFQPEHRRPYTGLGLG